MTSRTLPFPGTQTTGRTTAARARKENLFALAFAAFAAVVLSLTLLPPHPQSDPSQVDALEFVAGP